jgi:hypothetical protein
MTILKIGFGVNEIVRIANICSKTGMTRAKE